MPEGRRPRGASQTDDGETTGHHDMTRGATATIWTAAALWLLAPAACAAPPDREVEAEGAPRTAETEAAPGAPGAPATPFEEPPPGGLPEWIADIRDGLRDLPARARQDPVGAQRQALELYLSRQEVIERYYGAGGPRTGPALGEAVEAGELRFHELLRLTARTPPPDSGEVAEAVAALEAQLEEVLRRARAEGVPLTAPQSDGGEPGGGVSAADEQGLRDGEEWDAVLERDAAEERHAALERDAEEEWDAALEGDLEGWLDAVARGLEGVVAEASEGRGEEARRRALRLYLNHYEAVEGVYGPGAPHGVAGLAERVAEGEATFHALLGGDAREIPELAAELGGRLEAIRGAAREAGVPLRPRLVVGPAAVSDGTVGAAASAAGRPAGPRHPEVAALLQELREAEAAYRAGDTAAALAGVERAYLEGFEPLEPRLPMTQVRRVERLFHLRLRPEIARGAPEGAVEASFAALYGELAAVEEVLARDARFWFGAFNAFVIILREGLEAVLLIAAILAYLSRVSSDPGHRRQVFAGAGLGVAASLGTWAVAQLLIPVGGASRELIEGATALLAVCVLVYVSHWLFHKTYVHDWTRYLTGRVDLAVSTGSALAMAALAFAAVYREGFETVLFYQALLMDVGAGAILAGFLPGVLLIVAVGLGIIRLGLRLPLRRVFGATNAILLYLAFVFLGKGLYNLQEAGLFAPHPLPWAPDHEALRQLLGIHPVAETLAAQAAFLLFMAGSYLYYRRRSGARSARTEAAGAAGERRSRVRREGASDASPRAVRPAARQVPTSPSG